LTTPGDQRVCRPKLGTVGAFDREVGLGEVRAGDGRLYPFHCTEIADGTRDIAVGAEVTFVLVAGHRGTREARGLVSI
jgi:cold shock CspA family protein